MLHPVEHAKYEIDGWFLQTSLETSQEDSQHLDKPNKPICARNPFAFLS